MKGRAAAAAPAAVKKLRRLSFESTSRFIPVLTFLLTFSSFGSVSSRPNYGIFNFAGLHNAVGLGEYSSGVSVFFPHCDGMLMRWDQSTKSVRLVLSA